MAIFKVTFKDEVRYVEATKKCVAEQHVIDDIVTAIKLTDKEALAAVRSGAVIEVTTVAEAEEAAGSDE